MSVVTLLNQTYFIQQKLRTEFCRPVIHFEFLSSDLLLIQFLNELCIIPASLEQRLFLFRKWRMPSGNQIWLSVWRSLLWVHRRTFEIRASKWHGRYWFECVVEAVEEEKVGLDDPEVMEIVKQVLFILKRLHCKIRLYLHSITSRIYLCYLLKKRHNIVQSRCFRYSAANRRLSSTFREPMFVWNSSQKNKKLARISCWATCRRILMRISKRLFPMKTHSK